MAERRFGGDPDTRRRFMAELTARRDRVLDLAQFLEGGRGHEDHRTPFIYRMVD